MSNSSWPHGLQHARPPCSSLPTGVSSNSCPLSQWRHPAISSSVIHFPSCLQSFPASGFFSMSQLFISSVQIIGASASVLPMTIQGWFHLGLTSLNSFQPRDSQESSPAPWFKRINSSAFKLLYVTTLTSVLDYWKNYSFDYLVLYWQSNVSTFQYTV